MKNLILVSDFDFSRDGFPASGYSKIAVTLGNALTDKGWKVHGFGVTYNRKEINTKFGINSIRPNDIPQMISTLHRGVGIEKVLYVFDIPFIEMILNNFQNFEKLAIKQYGIFAVEADPLCMSWALSMSRLNGWGVISEFGKNEANKAGLPAEHYPVPINLNIWKERTLEEKLMVKEALGLKDKYVIFINGDGNERKNHSAMLEGLAIAKKTNPNIHAIMLTRKNSPFSWKLDDLMVQLDIIDNLTIVDRGIPEEDVWKLYVGSDAFYNLSKAEGLCLPILEAMAVGVPVVATNATAMKESLQDKRGILLDADYIWIDPFGNTNRYFVYPEKIAKTMIKMSQKDDNYTKMTKAARKYVESRTVENAVEVAERILNA